MFYLGLALHCGRIKHEADEQVLQVGTSPTSEKSQYHSLSIDMNKTAENTKTATQKAATNPHQMKGVMAAVTAVVGEEPDTFADVDEHPGSLDLPTQEHETTKLLAEMKRQPKGSAERFQAFRKLLKVLHDEYAE